MGNYDRYDPSRNPTYYEHLVQHILDDVREGVLPHGGNFHVLAVFAPSLATDTLERILDEFHIPPDAWPTDIDGIAGLFQWDDPEHKEFFIEQQTGVDEATVDTRDPQAAQRLAIYLNEIGVLGEYR